MDSFEQHLKDASARVATWPAWKQNVLGKRKMTDSPQFDIEIVTRYTCKKCGSVVSVPFKQDACHPDQCPMCATGDIHIDSTPLRRGSEASHQAYRQGMPCW